MQKIPQPMISDPTATPVQDITDSTDGWTHPPVPENPSAVATPANTTSTTLPKLPTLNETKVGLGDLLLVSANVQGLNEPEKLDDLYRTLRTGRVHVALLQETKLTPSKADHARTLWRNDAVFGCAMVSARGVAILFSANSPLKPDLNKAIVNHRFIAVPCKWNGKPLLLLNSYAPNDSDERLQYFRSVIELVLASDLLSPDDLTIVWGGDFNCTDNQTLDRLNPGLGGSFPTILREFLEEMALVDTFRLVNSGVREFTWSGVTSTRIDYVFLTRTAAHRISEIRHLHNTRSDHKMVALVLSPENPVMFGRAPWTLRTDYLKSPAFQKNLNVLTGLSPPHEFPSKTEWFSNLCQEVKAAATEHAVRLKVIRQAKLRDLYSRLSALETRLAATPQHPTLKLSIKATKIAIFKITKAEMDWSRLHSAAKFFKEGEKCTKYFSSFVKKRQADNSISALKTPEGNQVSSTTEILDAATAFYNDLYAAPNTDNDAQQLLLDNLKARVPAAAVGPLEASISVEEVRKAIRDSPTGKAPGPDGLPAELWKTLPEISAPMTDMFNEWLSKGEIPRDVKTGTITLLFKKGDPTCIKNYRPITLLNTTLKILTKVLNNRLKGVIGDLITPVQTGISGRYIGETVRTMSDLLAYAKANKTPLALLLLDQEKAFDKVSHTFLQKVLQTMGFGPVYRRWIHLLYDGAQSRLKINNTLGDKIQLLRGVRQGDCLSPNLFVLCLEPFLQAIINDPNIAGVKLPDGQTLKVMAYADDSTPVTSSPGDLPHLEKWMHIYEKATGATFSRAKSELTVFNMKPPTGLQFFDQENTVADNFHRFRFLGVPLDFHQGAETPWEGPILKFRNVLKQWQSCSLSLQGKCVVLKHFAYPTLLYHAQTLHIGKDDLEEIRTAAWKFLWNHRRARVNETTAKIPKEFGGIGYPDFEDQLNKIQARWITRLLENWNSGKPWVTMAKWAIGGVNAEWGHGASTIAVRGDSHAAKQCQIKFWGGCLQAFWELNPHYPLLHNPESAMLARSTPLFNNPTILHRGHPLKGNRWKGLPQLGIRRLCDLMFFDHVGTYEELCRFYGPLPRELIQDLLDAIPEDLATIASITHPLNTADWAHIDDDGSHTVYMAQLNTPGPHKWHLSRRRDPDPEYLGITPFSRIEELRPARIEIQDEGGIFLEYLDCIELHPDNLIYAPPPPTHPTPKNQTRWDLILRPPPQLPMEWNRVYKALWNTRTPNRWKDLAWLIARHSLFLGHNATVSGFLEIPGDCSLCDRDIPETHTHLFYHCPEAQKAWRWAASMWRRSRRRNLPLSLELALFGGDQLWRTLSQSTTYAIWKARCSTIFNDPVQPLPILKALTKQLIKTHHKLKLPIKMWSQNGAFGHVKDDHFIFSSF